MKKKMFIKSMLLAVIMLVVGNGTAWGQGILSSPVFQENFGTLTDATVLTTSNTAFSFVRVSTSATSNTIVNQIVAKNPGSFTGGSGLISAKGGSISTVDKTALTSFSSGTFTLKFKTPASLTSALMFSAVGTGASFGSSNGFTGAQLSAAFQVTGTNLQIRATGAWTTVQTVAVSTNYEICIVFNNTGGSLSYGDSKTLPSNKCHVWINGSYINEYSTGTASLAASAFRIYTTTAQFEVDDIAVYNSLPAAPSCTAPTFSFATPTSVSKLTTDAAFTNTFTTNNTSPKAFTSSNTGVATVNATSGEVTIVGAGTTTIGVTQVADGTRCAVSTSYALTVSTPTISLTPTTLTNFTYISGSGPSEEQTFIVSGTNLAGDISIAAPTNYEISKTSGSGYTSPLNFTQSGGSVSSTTVYVRLKAGLSAANYNSEVITATSTGATDKTVTCSGSVTAAAPTATPTFSPVAGTYTSVQNVTLASATAGAKIYYTTNGTDPTSASTLYSSAIAVSTTTTIKAIAYDASDANPSSIASALFTINIPVPTITLTPTTLTGFTYVLGAGASTEQTFTVLGADLSGDVSIAAPTNYEISKSTGTGYTTPLVYTPVQVATAQTVYVRLKAGLNVASYNSETITATSTGATAKTVTCSGSVTAPPAPVAPTATAATSVTSSGFTANWGAVSGATGYYLDVYSKTAGSGVTITQGFDAGTTVPTDWTFTAIGATYTSAGNFGASSPSLKFDATADAVLSPTLPSSATELSFWMRGQTSTGSSLLVEGYNGSTWVQIDNIVTPSNTATTYLYTSSSTPALPSSLTRFRFTYTKVTSNIAFDDVIYKYGSAAVNTPITGSPFTENVLTSKEITGLSASTNYYYVVRAYNGTGSSANSNEIAATTTVGSTPTITVSETTLTGFTYAQGSGPSAEQSFTVSGVNLTNDISIAATTNYEISKTSGSGYTTPLTFTHSGGTVSEQTVYVRLKAGLSAGNFNDEVINITSSGATTKTLTCSGSVSVPLSPEPSNHASAFSATTNTTTQITVIWTDATGGQAPDGYLVKASTTTPTAPADGAAEADATLVKNIAQGTQSVVFTGLSASTTYNFAIWPYTNSGASIDYKIGSHPTTSATTETPLGVPVATAASSISATGFTANWNAISDASSYRLDVSTNASFSSANLFEDFNLCTVGSVGSADIKDMSFKLDSLLHSTGWSGSKVYQAGGLIKLGTGTLLGYITTKTIDLSSNSGTATLTFDLQKYGTDAAALVQIFHAPNGVDFTQVGSDITPPATIANQSLSITGGTVNSKIKITAKVAASNRFYIDNLIVVQDGQSNIVTDQIVSGTSQTVTGLTPGTTYNYRVRAVGGNSTSVNSNVITVVTTGGTSSVVLNGSTTFTYSGTAQSPAFTVIGSTGAVSYVYSGTGATTYNSTSTPTEAGTYSVIATVAADETYNTASSLATAFTISKANQTITFAALSNKTVGDANYSLSATSATSGINTIIYSSSDQNVATIVSGNQIHIVGGGVTTITSSQALSANYNAATNAHQSLTVLLSSPIIQPSTDVVATAFTANWSAVPGATNYDVSLYQDASLISTVNVLAPTLSHTFTGLSIGVSYSAKVIAKNDYIACTSPASNSLIIINADADIASVASPTTDLTVKGGITLSGGGSTINSLTIESGGSLNLTSAVTVGDVTFKVDETSSFTAHICSCNSTVNGTVKLWKSMNDSKWYFMSFPSAVKISEITKSDGSSLGILGVNWYIKWYDGDQRANHGTTLVNWKSITNADLISNPNLSLTAYKGYIIGIQNSIDPLIMSFTLEKSVFQNEIEKSISVSSYSTGAAGGNNLGWNLVGQPYLSKFTSQGGTNVPYILVPDGAGTYDTHSSEKGDLPIINPFTSYFVQANTGLEGTGITFGLAARHVVSTTVATKVSDVVELNVTTATGTDNTNLILDDAQSTAYQIGQDMEKWIGTGTDKPQVYSLLSGINYAFNALPMSSVVNLPVGVYTKTAGSTTISIDASLAPTLSKLLLTDTKAVPVTVTDLLTSNYSYTATAGTDNTRFKLTAQRVPTGIETINEGDLESATIKMVNGRMLLDNLSAKTSVRVYDAIGRLVTNKTTNNNSLEIPLNTEGIYTIQLVSGNKSWTKKMVYNR